MDSASFWVIRAVDQALEPGMNQSSGAHGARFNCSKQFTAFQAMVTEGGTGLAQGDYLGMGSGIGVCEVAVAAASDDFAVVNHDRADWNFSSFESTLGVAEGFFHEEFVCVLAGVGMGFR
jgi:hypothetical protein